MPRRTTLVAVVFLVAIAATQGASLAWDYTGPLGPSTWASKFSKCDAAFQQQAPIALASASSVTSSTEESFSWVDLTKVTNVLAVKSSMNNGFSLNVWSQGIQLETDANVQGVTVTTENKDQEIPADAPTPAPDTKRRLQLHSMSMHQPSEHSVNGKEYPMEMKFHFFHPTTEGTDAAQGNNETVATPVPDANASAVTPTPSADNATGTTSTGNDGLGALVFDEGAGGITISVLLDRPTTSSKDLVNSEFSNMLFDALVDRDLFETSGGYTVQMPQSSVLSFMPLIVGTPATTTQSAFRYDAGASMPPCRQNMTHYVLAGARTVDEQVFSVVATYLKAHVENRHWNSGTPDTTRPRQAVLSATTITVVDVKLPTPPPPPVPSNFSMLVSLMDDQHDPDVGALKSAFASLLVVTILLVLIIAYQSHERGAFINDEREVWKNPLTEEEWIGAIGDEEDEDEEEESEEDEESDYDDDEESDED